jgi:hypothetical protein
VTTCLQAGVHALTEDRSFSTLLGSMIAEVYRLRLRQVAALTSRTLHAAKQAIGGPVECCILPELLVKTQQSSSDINLQTFIFCQVFQ